MSPSKKFGLRFGASLLIATTPLILLASGCGGGNAPFNPLPTFVPTGTSQPIATNTPFATATPAPTEVGATALEFASLGTGLDNDGSVFEQGWRFTANRALSVTALGFYDQSKDGLSTSHRVGIFDVANRLLVGSTTVLRADPLTGYFRFHTLSAPFALTPGRDYYIVAVLNSGADGYATGVTPTVNTAITFRSSATNMTGVGSGALIYPDSTTSFTNGNFGPTFRFN